MRPSNSNQRHYQQPSASDMYMLTPGSERYTGESYVSYHDFTSHTPPVYPSPYDITLSSQDTTNSQLSYAQESMSLAMVAPLPVIYSNQEEGGAAMIPQIHTPVNNKHQQKQAQTNPVLPICCSSTSTSTSPETFLAVSTAVSEATLSLSLNIEPSISVTEPTPIHNNNTSSLDLIDQFIAQHTSVLEIPSSNNNMINNSDTQLLDSFFDGANMSQHLLTTNNDDNQWLSWTPFANNSPVSVASQTFDNSNNNNQFYAASPDFRYADMSVSVGYPSPDSNIYYQNMMNDPNLTIRMTRDRQYSEPPMPTYHHGHYMQQQQQQQQQVQVLSRPAVRTRKAKVEKRSRSNSTSATHACMHPGCGKTFTRPYNLTSHMRTHTLDRPFACTQCGRRFARQHDRNRHEKLHWGIKPYACNHCRKPFARMDALNRHLRVENGCGTLEERH